MELPNRFKWDEKQKKRFIETLKSEEMKKIIVETDQLLEAEQLLEVGLIESTGTKFQEICRQTAETCLKKSNTKIYYASNKNKKIKNKKNKKWYDIECINKKNKASLLARKKLQKEEHKKPLKGYRHVLRFNQIEFWKKEQDKIEENNTDFWKVWKSLGEEKNVEH